MTDQEIGGALERAATTLRQKPSVGQRVYLSTAVVQDGVSCRVQEKGHAMLADLPPAMGGENLAPSPSALLRAALSSCVAMGVKMWAARRGIPIRRVEVRVETGVDARGQFGVGDGVAPGFENVRVSIDVDSPAEDHVIREMIETSLRFSAVMDVFRQAQAIETQVNLTRPALENR